MSLRKIALLILIVGFAATVETAWNLQCDIHFGAEGCRVMGGRFYGPSWTYEASAERAATAAAPRKPSHGMRAASPSRAPAAAPSVFQP